MGLSLDDDNVAERVRRHMEGLRAQATLSTFLKPAETQVGRWAVRLSFGSAEEMEKLQGLEAVERERMKMPPRARTRPRPTWMLSCHMVNLEGVEEVDFAELGMIAKGAGVPESTIGKAVEVTTRTGEKVWTWQWND